MRALFRTGAAGYNNILCYASRARSCVGIILNARNRDDVRNGSNGEHNTPLRGKQKRTRGNRPRAVKTRDLDAFARTAVKVVSNVTKNFPKS